MDGRFSSQRLPSLPSVKTQQVSSLKIFDAILAYCIGAANFCEGHCGQGPKNGEVMNASYSSDLRRRLRQKEYELVENIPFEPIEHRPRSVQNVD